MKPVTRVVILLLVCAALAAWAVPRLQLSYDLGAFLPAPTTEAQKVLSSRLGQGPGAQLIFLKLSDSSANEAMTIASQLRLSAGISRVLPEQPVLEPGRLPEALWRNRLLLGDIPNNFSEWQEILAQRADDLAFGADDDLLALVAADPALLTVNALERISASISQPHFDQGSTQFLMIEVTAPSYDLAAQAEVVAEIRAILASARTGTATTLILGNPVYGVDLQSSVRFEATLFSLVASAALLMLMILRFRSPFIVVSVALPLLAGSIFGLLALTLFFSGVHGITLAFGFTLLGVAIDYPLHLFTHAKASSDRAASIWPTLRLGIASTLIAYGAFFFSDSVGLQQLGVFAFFGIIGAALATAWVGADTTLNATADHQQSADSQQQLRFAPSLLVATAAGALLLSTNIFNDNLASLTPVDKQLLEADSAIRRDLGVTDIRYLLAVRADTREACLQATEFTYTRLNNLTEAGYLSGAQSIAQILPSRALQNARRHALAGGKQHFEHAVQMSDFQTDAFVPFIKAWDDTIANPAHLSLEDLMADPDLQGLSSTLLYQQDGAWVSLVFLQGITDHAALAAEVNELPSTQWIDLKATSESMVTAYRERLLQVLAVALLAIAALLIFRTSIRRTCWLLATMASAVLVAAAMSTVLHAGLSLFDLMALTLVAGLGLDYALFYSRDRVYSRDGVRGADTTASAVFICAASSLIVFGTLAFSSVPVLAGIGSTVAFGVLGAYLLARFGRYANTGN